MSIEMRMDLIFAAIGKARMKLANVPAGKIRRIAGGFDMTQDFSGDSTAADRHLELLTVIHEISAFSDHLTIRLADLQKKRRNSEVEEFFKRNRAFRIIHDLNNLDKHGGKDRHGGWSNEGPEIRDIRRIAECKVGAGKTTAGMVFGLDGKPTGFGDGDSGVVTTSEVYDKNGSRIGMAHEFINEAISVCEAAINHFGAR